MACPGACISVADVCVRTQDGPPACQGSPVPTRVAFALPVSTSSSEQMHHLSEASSPLLCSSLLTRGPCAQSAVPKPSPPVEMPPEVSWTHNSTCYLQIWLCAEGELTLGPPQPVRPSCHPQALAEPDFGGPCPAPRGVRGPLPGPGGPCALAPEGRGPWGGSVCLIAVPAR